MFIDQAIVDFVEWSIEERLVDSLDRVYTLNRLLALLKKDSISHRLPTIGKKNGLQLLDQLVDYAVKKGIIEELSAHRDQLAAQLMDVVTPKPSEVNERFWKEYEQSPKDATDAFFNLSKKNNYIKTREISKNIEYKHATEYGELEITINLSKPEKDPKEIMLAKDQGAKINYPSCLLCMENEGYKGHLSHPGRANHRIIRMTVSDEEWGFQYSPYAYYNEHAIFLSSEHRKMDVGVPAIRNLLEILTILPHYFVGSNAGLPIVGGSILSHDHYQGGRYTFPLEVSDIEYAFGLSGFETVKAGMVKWPMSVVRLESTDKEELIKAADLIMTRWSSYHDESVGIYSETNGTPHNAITPIARRKGEAFVLDMVLRNNRTSSEWPDGIFHPHPDVQHIKKENIGLIEVMGLAILPPRLKEELEAVRQYLTGKEEHVATSHKKWADQLKATRRIDETNVKSIVDEAVGDVFLQVLKDAGVFKRDEEGKEAFKRFINYLSE